MQKSCLIFMRELASSWLFLRPTEINVIISRYWLSYCWSSSGNSRKAISEALDFPSRMVQFWARSYILVTSHLMRSLKPFIE
jgi:hypothetical protein